MFSPPPGVAFDLGCVSADLDPVPASVAWVVRVHIVAVDVHLPAVAAMVICLHGGMARPAEADDVVWIVLQPGVIMALDDMVNLGRECRSSFGFAVLA